MDVLPRCSDGALHTRYARPVRAHSDGAAQKKRTVRERWLTLFRRRKKMHRSAVQGAPIRRGTQRGREKPRAVRPTHNMGDQP